MLQSAASTSVLAVLAATIALAACSPDFDWREVRGKDAPYLAVFPAKPSSSSRTVTLNGAQVNMTMTATQVNGYTFAVGSAAMQDASSAQAAVPAMKSALLANMGGTARRERWLTAPGKPAMLELEASGPPAKPGEPGRLLAARFTARGNFAYQVVALGPDRKAPREEIDMFLSSFKLEPAAEASEKTVP